MNESDSNKNGITQEIGEMKLGVSGCIQREFSEGGIQRNSGVFPDRVKWEEGAESAETGFPSHCFPFCKNGSLPPHDPVSMMMLNRDSLAPPTVRSAGRTFRELEAGFHWKSNGFSTA